MSFYMLFHRALPVHQPAQFFLITSGFPVMSLPEVARMQSQERRSGTHGRRMRENRAGGACDSHCAGPLPQGPGLLSPIVSAQGEARAFPGRIGAQRVPREIRTEERRGGKGG